MGSRFKAGTISAVWILLLSLVLWVLYYISFKDEPDRGLTTIIVLFSALSVFSLIAIIRRVRNRQAPEKKG
jgi:drug/metabolite transporter (DMT)-like permease